MKAIVRRVHSPDVADLRHYSPKHPEVFGFLVQLLIGPDGGEGEESFDLTVCSPKWLMERHRPEDVVLGRHHLIMFTYNYERMKRAIDAFCATCEGASWEQLARKLGRLGKWEFEDYGEHESE